MPVPDRAPRSGLLRAVRDGAAWLGLGLAAGGLIGGMARGSARPAAPAPGVPVMQHAADAGEQENLPPVRHEASDMGLRPMLVAGVLMLLALGGVLGLSMWLYPGSRTDKSLVPPGTSEFPAPRLQADVGADMARFRAEQLQQLNGAYWLDRDRGVVHMPINDAMRDVAGRGIPDWPAAPAWVRR